MQKIYMVKQYAIKLAEKIVYGFGFGLGMGLSWKLTNNKQKSS